MEAISSIAGLLSFCGISSMRMFAPTFLFGAICRFLPEYSWCPSQISELAASCPPFLTGDFGLCVFGVLGVLEIINSAHCSNLSFYCFFVLLFLSYSISVILINKKVPHCALMHNKGRIFISAVPP